MKWIILALAVAVLSTATSIIHKKTLKKEKALEVSSTFAFFIVILSLFLIPLVNFDFPKKYLPVIYLISWFATVAFYLIQKALRDHEISSVLPLLNFDPMVVAILAFIFLGEKISLIHLAGIVLIVFGGYVLETRHFTKLKESFSVIKRSKYIHYVMLAVLLYAFSATGDKLVLNKGISPITYMFFANLFVGINYIILMHLMSDGFKGIVDAINKTGKLIFVAAILAVGLRVTQFYAFTLTSIAMVLSVKRLSSLLTVIIGGEIFHDHNLRRKITASIIMIAGIVLVTI